MVILGLKYHLINLTAAIIIASANAIIISRLTHGIILWLLLLAAGLALDGRAAGIILWLLLLAAALALDGRAAGDDDAGFCLDAEGGNGGFTF